MEHITARTSTKSSRKAIPDTVRRSMALMCELRQAPLPSEQALRAISSALAGFPEAVIEQGLQSLSERPMGEYEPRMPILQAMIESCRNTAQKSIAGRWCGRCQYGVIRGSDGQVNRCPCSCYKCNNSGMMAVTKSGELYDYLRHEGQTRFVRRCDCRRAA